MSSNFLQKKNAQSMSMNVIIIAAISLIVLVVLVFIFTGKIRMFGTGLDDCRSKGGLCEGNYETKQCPSGSGKAPILNTNCEDSETGGRTLCCISVYK